MEKLCSRCKQPFEKVSNDTYCKPCRSEYSKEWFQKNKEKHRQNGEKNRNKYKTNGPVTILTEKLCQPCGNTFPLTEEFWNKQTSSSTGFDSRCRECSKEKQMAWVNDNRERKNELVRKSRAKNADKRREKYLQLKIEVLSHYSTKKYPECICCGETSLVFLCLDHKDGGGNKHRKTENIKNILWWIKKNNYPPLFQILCFNCNSAKAILEVCPHSQSIDSVYAQNHAPHAYMESNACPIS